MKTKKNILAVCDTEVEYAYNFMEYMNRKKNIPFEVQAFTSLDNLIEFGRSNRIEILLISDRTAKEDISGLDIGKLIILSEGVHHPRFDQYPSVYKYQSSDTVIREVMNCYGTEQLPELQIQTIKKDTELIGVYSPVGRAAKTSFAITLGQIMAKNRVVLYLNLEEYSGFEQLLQCQYERTLGDLIYYVRQGNTNLILKMNSMIQTMNNLDYLPPVLSPLDIQNTTYEEWKTLLSEIIMNSPYETVILDFGDGVGDLYALMDECRHIYMPVRTDIMSQAKIQQFEHLLQLWEYGSLQEKIQKIKLPYHHSQKQGSAYLDELVWSELGDYVQELLRQGK